MSKNLWTCLLVRCQILPLPVPLPTPSEIQRQVELETKQVELGINKLRKQTRKLEEQSYASASVYGNSIVDELMPRLVQHLTETEHRIKTRRNGAMYKEIAMFLDCISKEEACLVALKVFIDKVFSRKKKDNVVAAVLDSIGTAIEHECQIQYYKNEKPQLFKSIVDRYWHDSMGTNQKLVTTRTLWNRHEDTTPWATWPRVTRIKIGQWYVDAICSVTGWFSVERLPKSNNIFKPSEEFYAYQEEIFRLAELFCPLKLPMLTEPNEWGMDGQMGGYYSNRLTKNCQFIRRQSNDSRIRGQTPVEFLNRIQRTPYRINQFIAGVADILWEQGIEVGKFKPIKEVRVVPKPFDIATNDEARKEYCPNPGRGRERSPLLSQAHCPDTDHFGDSEDV